MSERRAGSAVGARRSRRVARVLAATALCSMSSGLLIPGAAEASPGRATTFVKGGAFATADTIGFAAVTSSAKVGLTLGRTIADYRENTGRSEARALDLGLLPTLFGELSRCDDTAALLPASSLPPVTAADSGEAGSENSRRTQAFYPGLSGATSTLPAGFQDAIATRQPSSSALTETPSQDISFFALINPRTEVSTRLDGQLRQAHAVVSADQLTVLNGLLRFEKPRWEAVSMSGASENAVGRFSFERAFIFEVPRTPEQISSDMGGLDGLLNGILGGLGVHFDQPRVIVEGRRVKVTPMVFRLTDPPIGAQALLPFFNNIAPLQQIFFDQLVKDDCNNQKTIQLVDVILQILKGSGSITIPVGGVEVNTDDRYFAPAEIGLPLAAPTTTTPQVSVATGPIASAPARQRQTTARNSPVSPPGSVDPIAVLGAIATTPSSEAPPPTPPGDESAAIDLPTPPTIAARTYRDGSTGGAATALGLMALLGAIGLLMADRFRMRRGARRIIS